MTKLKCQHCGYEFEITEDDIDVDASVEELTGEVATISLTVRVPCPKCGRRVLYYVDTIEVPIKPGKVVRERSH